MNEYQLVIGLEVHVELKTKSKMFCRCSADYFGQEPNTHTCPVCLGLPGALPVPNKTAIDWCIKIGLALSCEILRFSKFDRKNYFYPDLAKGYQISQYDEPFCINGKMTLSTGKTIRIKRVHMEEDTGKLSHGNEKSLIDFNRSGVPLVEIVTEPDFETAEEVVEYLKKLQQIVRYLDVSDADMEKGNMRLEPNISLRKKGETSLPSYKVEVKNINSFRFVEKAIHYEYERQKELLNSTTIPAQETRGWHETKQKTVSQRAKEEANDYRYFPEPDIPPIRIGDEYIESLNSSLGELPEAKLSRFQKEFLLSFYDSEILTREQKTADFFEHAVREGKNQGISPKQIANYIINKKISLEQTSPQQLIALLCEQQKKSPLDTLLLQPLIDDVLKENEKAVQDFKNGKESVIMFLLGMVMRKSKEKLDAQQVKELLLQKLSS